MKRLIHLFKKPLPQVTFTYFLQAPKQNKLSYQEKHFDQLIKKITSLGHEILDFKIESLNDQNVCGLWIVFILRPKNKGAQISFDTFTQSLRVGDTQEPLTLEDLDP